MLLSLGPINNIKQNKMTTFIIYLTSFAGLENEYQLRYEIVANSFDIALNYAKSKHPHNISEYEYWTLN